MLVAPPLRIPNMPRARAFSPVHRAALRVSRPTNSTATSMARIQLYAVARVILPLSGSRLSPTRRSTILSGDITHTTWPEQQAVGNSTRTRMIILKIPLILCPLSIMAASTFSLPMATSLCSVGTPISLPQGISTSPTWRPITSGTSLNDTSVTDYLTP